MTGGPVNLASRALGAGVVAASDEAFGAKEHLVLDADPDHRPGRFSLTGEIVDGWETRRRRDPDGVRGHDWALVRLGAPGVIHRVLLDTTGFGGNFPARYLVEGCALPGYPSPDELLAARWRELVPWQELGASGVAGYEVSDPVLVSHVRLRIDPDGGVARLRVLGRPVPDPAAFDGVTVDLLARGLGGLVTAFSDAYYTHPEVLTLPDLPRTMGEGWEARRRRDPPGVQGNDWAVLRLAAPGVPAVLEVDTSYYVYNASNRVAVWAACPDDVPPGEDPGPDHPAWFPLLPPTALQPDTRHRFRTGPLPADVPDVGWVRLDVFPDAGLARVRLHGSPSARGRERLVRAWRAARPPDG